MINKKKFILLFTFVFVLLNSELSFSKTPEVIVIQNSEILRAEKEAILVLPGVGDSKKRRKHQKAFFEKMDYDLFIPDYIERKSYVSTLENLSKFYEDQNLGDYKKVHVFSYILGSWILNEYINKNGHQNIATIVYDRSPLQERAPQVAVDKMPLLTKIIKGKIIKDLTEHPYPSIDQKDIRIGIIVENKATRLIRIFKKKTLSYGPINWNNLNFDQSHDDLMFTKLNHDQMYFSFDVIGTDIMHFIEHGSFSTNARRDCYNWDVFEKLK